MPKIIILSILLLLIYQFDELVRVVRRILFGKRYHYHTRVESDYHVGTLLAIAGMPLILNYLVVSDQPLAIKFIILAAILLLFSILASGMGIFIKRLKQLSHYENINTFVGVSYAVAGLFHPIMRAVPWHSGRARLDLAKLAFMLSIPLILAVIFKSYNNGQDYSLPFQKYLDVLIVVMVGGLFIQITMKAMERYMSRNKFELLGYVRIVLGIGLALYFIL